MAPYLPIIKSIPGLLRNGYNRDYHFDISKNSTKITVDNTCQLKPTIENSAQKDESTVLHKNDKTT